MSLASYLAKNYLNADTDGSKKTKKRKRKDKAGLVIADDDATGWNDPRSKKGNGSDASDGDDDNPEGGRPLHVGAARSAEFRRAKNSNWVTLAGAKAGPEDVRGSTTSSSQQQQSKAPSRKNFNVATDDDLSAAADAIIASAAAEMQARRDAEDEDEAPAVAEGGGDDNDDDDDDGGPTMESGAKAGLQRASELEKQLRRAKLKDGGGGGDGGGRGGKGGADMGETIYRDASGRIINVAMKRAELRAAAAAEERRKAQEVQEARGDVQRAQAEERRQAVKDAKYLTVARHADDEEMNRELKERERWNDPASGFLENAKTKTKSATGRPLYKGDAPPNRYGIRPGHKWDGVDRGNGFEKEYFAAQNRRNNVRNLEYAWQMDE